LESQVYNEKEEKPIVPKWTHYKIRKSEYMKKTIFSLLVICIILPVFAQNTDSTMIPSIGFTPGTTDVYASGGTADSYLGVVVNNPTVYEPEPPPPAPVCIPKVVCVDEYISNIAYDPYWSPALYYIRRTCSDGCGSSSYSWIGSIFAK
jgi:hypothetical protein